MKQLSTALVLAISVMTGCSWGGDESGGQINPPTPDASISAAVCGDSVCAASEVGSCTQDCGSGNGSGSSTVVCGNNVCDAGETNASCPNDCTGGGGGGSGSGTCPADITMCIGCLIDASLCPPGLDATTCTACISGGGGGGGLPGANCNNDGTCDSGEDSSCILDNCP